ncbi:hypothetical protein CMV_008272 [Castanea mollissima]|uniref:Uncharacterized protein n=1 Tax=Castanea mollissima TaxID=60419 RepID=A0A8J4VZN3_9ROSI|nr:hypothetical protein CMV_008272 [Castanea mollissima]
MVPTQILAVHFENFNPDHLFKLLAKLVTGRIGSVYKEKDNQKKKKQRTKEAATAASTTIAVVAAHHLSTSDHSLLPPIFQLALELQNGQ